jgi:subtilase family serine protease
VPTAFSTPTKAITAGQTLQVTFTVANQGAGTAPGTWLDQIRLSTDATYDAGDTFLLNVLPAGPLAAGDSYTVTDRSVTIPAGTAPGAYFLVFKTDAALVVTESDEANNTAITAIPITVQLPDLVPTAFSTPTTTITAGQTLQVTFTVANQGTAMASGTWIDQVRLSTDATFDTGDTFLHNVLPAGPLAAGDSYTVTNESITIPAGTTPGAYFLVFKTDVLNAVTEGNEANNTAIAAIPITVQ